MPETQLTSPEWLAGIGASAGGLDTIERFFNNAPIDSGLAFVVVQHLSPDFKSMMNELLARHTAMPIRLVEDDMPIEANGIYLIPPRKNMVIADGKLKLTEQDPDSGLQLPIDVFFRSLAENYGDHGIAVVLSGTGSDGSRGLQSVPLAMHRDRDRLSGWPVEYPLVYTGGCGHPACHRPGCWETH